MTGTVRELAVNAAADTANAKSSPASLIFSILPLDGSNKERNRKEDGQTQGSTAVQVPYGLAYVFSNEDSACLQGEHTSLWPG